MSVAADDDGGMTLGEIGRRLADVIAELRALRGEVVRRDVYDANRAADLQRIAAVEGRQSRDDSDRGSLRRLVYAALLSTAGALVVAIVGAVMAAVARR